MAGSLTQHFAQEGVIVASTAASVNPNRDCTCLTLDREALGEALIRETGNPSFCTSLMETRPHASHHNGDRDRFAAPSLSGGDS